MLIKAQLSSPASNLRVLRTPDTLNAVMGLPDSSGKLEAITTNVEAWCLNKDKSKYLLVTIVVSTADCNCYQHTRVLPLYKNIMTRKNPCRCDCYSSYLEVDHFSWTNWLTLFAHRIKHSSKCSGGQPYFDNSEYSQSVETINNLKDNQKLSTLVFTAGNSRGD